MQGWSWFVPRFGGNFGEYLLPGRSGVCEKKKEKRKRKEK